MEITLNTLHIKDKDSNMLNNKMLKQREDLFCRTEAVTYQ